MQLAGIKGNPMLLMKLIEVGHLDLMESLLENKADGVLLLNNVSYATTDAPYWLVLSKNFFHYLSIASQTGKIAA